MSNDIRAALERLLQQLATLRADPYSPLQLEHAEREARAALAAEPVGEGPSDEDLIHTYAHAVAAAVDAHPGALNQEDAQAAQLAGLRAVLSRWGRPAAPPAPEPGDVGAVGEFIAQLKSYAEKGTPIRLVPSVVTRAATLLEQLSAPAPVVVPVAEISDPAVLAITESLGMIAMECAVQAAKRDPEGAHRRMVQEARGAILEWLNAIPLPQIGEGQA